LINLLDMKKASQLRLEFYQLLGKLFYSIAVIDKVVRKQEIEQLREIVKKEWIPIEREGDEFGTEAAYHIEIVFDWLLQNDWEIGPILAEFKQFKRKHPRLFSKMVIDLIDRTALAIADAFAGKNKIEKYFVHDLERILKERN
jgi:hypothetical protein